ncbi:AT-rich interactive domain-containing protein 5B-like isoform X2 [Dermacentor andersoni]|uniref:AT-rich interactive domain-containing protein 5B-like isoform X2 n=1 Tax=Dermacentor andersoni TaxID=34620 RepID=UPI0024180EB5|nr:AT-rich interactive domain-containing protein 5B-like isoform X2 [Dermacentor andersoni]
MSFVGDPRGRSSSCTFYGGFEYKNRSGPATLSVGQFVYVRISPNDDPCIAELQLLWKDHQHSAQLASVQLYFLPEQTPDGRLPHQGQHEVLAASEKAVLRLEDFVGCITDEVEWSHGLLAGPPSEGTSSPGVVVLSYPRYCRYRALLKRLEGHWPPEGSLALLLGADQLLPRGGGACRLLFCRDTFDHEALAHNDLICDHLAPVERGRQRKRIRKANSGSESSEEGSSEVTAAPSTPSKPSVHHGKTAQDKTADVKLEKVKSEKMSLDSIPEVKPAKEKTAQDKVPLDRMPQGRMSQDLLPDTVPQERKPHDKILLDKTRNGADEFLRRLFQFMKERNTPIQRVPHLGFKQIYALLYSLTTGHVPLDAPAYICSRILTKKVIPLTSTISTSFLSDLVVMKRSRGASSGSKSMTNWEVTQAAQVQRPVPVVIMKDCCCHLSCTCVARIDHHAGGWKRHPQTARCWT